ncbi:MAG TPA: PAS domain S-box protein [Polyangiaceae bacterium]|nr:PAS domain S-box protein [Polyangiaceae bacterium]
MTTLAVATKSNPRATQTIRPAVRHSGLMVALPFPERNPRTSDQLLSQLVHRKRNTEERYRLLFENANDAITLLSPDGIILEANQRWEMLFGMTRARMVGRSVQEFAAPGTETETMFGVSGSIAHGDGRNVATLCRSDGTPVLVEFSRRIAEIDGDTVVFTMGRDVTEAVRVREAAREAEQRYRLLVERIPEVLWTIDERGKLSFVTPNVETVLGFSAQEMCALSLDRCAEEIHPDERTRVLEAWQALLEHGTEFDIEYRRSSKDGHWIWIRNRVLATYVRDGVRYTDGILSDITERVHHEQALRVAQKMEAVAELSGVVAHDFNDVLSAILVHADFLLHALESGVPRRDDALAIKEITHRGAALTRRLLALSQR